MPHWSMRRRVEQLLPRVLWSNGSEVLAMGEVLLSSPRIEVGAGGRRLDESIVCIDVVAHRHVDIRADAHQLPLPGNSIGGVVCTGTLEHVRRPWLVVEEFRRVVRPAGLVYVEVPFIQPIHADPHDYWRMTPEGLRVLFEDWHVMQEGMHMGSGAGLAWTILEAAKAGARSRAFRVVVHVVASLALQPLRVMDYARPSPVAASGFWLLARRPAADAVEPWPKRSECAT